MAEGVIPVFTVPDEAQPGDQVSLSADIQNTGSEGTYYWLVYYDLDDDSLVYAYPKQFLRGGGSATAHMPTVTKTMPNKDWNLVAKLFAGTDSNLTDTQARTISLEVASACDGDTSWRPAGYIWAHCLGDEEECVSVEFGE